MAELSDTRNEETREGGDSYVDEPRDFRGQNLENSDFQGKLLVEQWFDGADLSGANLKGANCYMSAFPGVDFTGADLRGVNFYRADLEGAIFEGALLDGAIFDGALNVPPEIVEYLDAKGEEAVRNVSSTVFGWENPGIQVRRQMYREDCDDIAKECAEEGYPSRGSNYDLRREALEEYYYDDLFGPINLHGSYLKNVDFHDRDLEDADLRRSLLDGADLSGANLNSADLSHSFLNGAHFEEADLDFANFYCAHLNNAHLECANLYMAGLAGADLTGANLRGADLEGADLTGADLEGADLTGANLTDASLDGVVWKGAILDGVKLDGARNVPPELLEYIKSQRGKESPDQHLSDLSDRIKAAQQAVAGCNADTAPGSKGPGEFANPDGAGEDR